MVEEVEEVHEESQVLRFCQLENFSQAEIHVLLRRPDDAVAGCVPEEGGVAKSTGGERSKGIWLIRRSIDPIRKTNRFAAGTERPSPAPLAAMHAIPSTLEPESSNAIPAAASSRPDFMANRYPRFATSTPESATAAVEAKYCALNNAPA